MLSKFGWWWWGGGGALGRWALCDSSNNHTVYHHLENAEFFCGVACKVFLRIALFCRKIVAQFTASPMPDPPPSLWTHSLPPLHHHRTGTATFSFDQFINVASMLTI